MVQDKIQGSRFSFIKTCEKSIFSIMISHKTILQTYLITATDNREKRNIKEFSVIVIINDEIFICLAMGICPITFYGS